MVVLFLANIRTIVNVKSENILVVLFLANIRTLVNVKSENILVVLFLANIIVRTILGLFHTNRLGNLFVFYREIAT